MKIVAQKSVFSVNALQEFLTTALQKISAKLVAQKIIHSVSALREFLTNSA